MTKENNLNFISNTETESYFCDILISSHLKSNLFYIKAHSCLKTRYLACFFFKKTFFLLRFKTRNFYNA